MKRYILISGILFYIITFLAIFYLTYSNYEESRPEGAKVINVNTYDKVWQPSRAGFDVGVATAHNALTDLGHAEAFAENTGDERAAMDAYGNYFKSLYTTGGEYKTPTVTGGEQAYTEAVCWHCHSQFVRPLASENHRWGPTSQIGEGAHDNPTRYGTRRIGPDLAREGLARPDDWHLAHFVNPKYTVPQSIMAPYGGIRRYWHQVKQDQLDERQKEVDAAMLEVGKQANGYQQGSLNWEVVSGLNASNDEIWHVYKGMYDSNGAGIVRAAKKPKQRILDLIAYLQTRGVAIGITAATNNRIGDTSLSAVVPKNHEWQRYLRKLDFSLGRWYKQAPAPRPTGRPDYVLAPAEVEAMLAELLGGSTDATIENVADTAQKREYTALRLKWDNSIKEGYNLFLGKCAGCHGGLDDRGDPLDIRISDPNAMMAVGNGYGPAAPWLVPEPRNFHLSNFSPYTVDGKSMNDDWKTPRERGTESIIYKNRSGHPDSPLARPEDLFHTIRNGMPPSAMPNWRFLTDWQVWSLVNFIMY
ncbi:MAG: cbb3-type cytochrome c oxidase subunit II, partial [Planctomycetes bacterium]|nr:cbb3-type cytochrome c oxidase subunit II [Planctomycetota bacterium]